MTESDFKELDKCPKCGHNTVARVRYVRENLVEVKVYTCQNCGTFKRENDLQSKLSKFQSA